MCIFTTHNEISHAIKTVSQVSGRLPIKHEKQNVIIRANFQRSRSSKRCTAGIKLMQRLRAGAHRIRKTPWLHIYTLLLLLLRVVQLQISQTALKKSKIPWDTIRGQWIGGASVWLSFYSAWRYCHMRCDQVSGNLAAQKSREKNPQIEIHDKCAAGENIAFRETLFNCCQF